MAEQLSGLRTMLTATQTNGTEYRCGGGEYIFTVEGVTTEDVDLEVKTPAGTYLDDAQYSGLANGVYRITLGRGFVIRFTSNVAGPIVTGAPTASISQGFYRPSYPSNGELRNIVAFTEDGNYVKPFGLTRVRVRVWGAGGASGGATTESGARGGNGGAGAYAEALFEAGQLLATTPITVGVGGVAGAAGEAGGDGGSSLFGTDGDAAFISVAGGEGGGFSADASVAGDVGSGGQDITVDGAVWSLGLTGAMCDLVGGNAPGYGGPLIITAVAGAVPGFAGEPGIMPGGGASGAVYDDADIAGAAGAGGLVIIEEYY